MAVFRRSGSPHYQVEFIYRGDRISRSTGTRSRRKAEGIERKLKEEIRKRPPPQASPLGHTLNTACGDYWEEHGKKLADQRNVERWLKYICRYLENKDMLLRDLSTKHVTALRTAMEAAGIKPISINRTIRTLQGVHNRAIKEWEEAVTPIVWKGKFSKEHARTNHISHKIAQTVLGHLPLHIREVVLFLLTTGLRRNEAFELRRSKVNLETQTVKVKVKGGYYRDVSLSAEAALILKTAPKRGKLPPWRPLASRISPGTICATPSRPGWVTPGHRWR
jgi:integrase